jgi:hypothetical protein
MVKSIFLEKMERPLFAWVLSTGLISDLKSPTWSISGSDPIDGFTPFLSSGCGELHGITAVSIIGRLLNEFQSTKLPFPM